MDSPQKGMISVSMMCVSIDQTLDYLAAFEKNGVELLHIDVMDGDFVPNITLGTDYVRQLRKLTKIPFDFHFMVTEPEEKMKWYDIQENDYVAVHYESTRHIDKCMQYIRSLGAKPILALNPGTPICVIEEVLDYLDGVLVMSVNPGFAGQKLIPGTLEKVKRVRSFLDERDRQDVIIESDGNMSNENVRLAYRAGSRIFVAGTSSIVKPSLDGVDERIAEKRKHMTL
ncbi:ribulose-phosphate 3-epimerase [Ruminococcus sp. Marseille-P6503]|uniref:ribulose-phosphate 3-epimerase n=1 Tax=Ruminococcus sp. Marseille-P6503 TaxID=2364796 RepID=UPI001FA9E727|nr:ribulose-phosphate 3-epimerase [Ruminococcus sp. Marseille-P6503]